MVLNYQKKDESLTSLKVTSIMWGFIKKLKEYLTEYNYIRLLIMRLQIFLDTKI